MPYCDLFGAAFIPAAGPARHPAVASTFEKIGFGHHKAPNSTKEPRGIRMVILLVALEWTSNKCPSHPRTLESHAWPASARAIRAADRIGQGRTDIQKGRTCAWCPRRPRQFDILRGRRFGDPHAAHPDDERDRHRDRLAADPGHARILRCHQKTPQRAAGRKVALSDAEKAIYEQVVLENATRLHLSECDALVVHDPQPLPLVRHFASLNMPWLWQCHIDLSAPNQKAWNYLRGFVDQYDAAIFSLPEYAQDLDVVQHFITPALDPFSAKNGELSNSEIDACLAHYLIPPDRPLVTQISRFDRWKDPLGVVEAFRKASEQVDCTLVLVGNGATDDPEGDVIFEAVRNSIDERVIVLTADDPVLVNALQRRAAVILQKSTREGFGLTVTEAMWKGAAVIGGDVGGIRRQIRDSENGFLVGRSMRRPSASCSSCATPTCASG